MSCQKKVRKGMTLRKIILLALPISVAFLIGGFAGSLLGKEDFFWPAAILWGTVIGIIDYNFSIMEELSKLGWLGRIVLIMTSAIITATVGDHIILDDTVKEAKFEHYNQKIEDLKDQPLLYSVREGLDEEIQKAKDNVDAITKQLADADQQEIDECRDGVGRRCKFMQSKVAKVTARLDSAETNLSDLQIEDAQAQIVALKRRAEAIGRLEDTRDNKHDIILEMKLLYEKIFEQKTTTIMFILFALMVVCIETLPMLLKSGVTIDQVREEEAYQACLKKKAEAAAKADREKQKQIERQLILRNNRV